MTESRTSGWDGTAVLLDSYDASHWEVYFKICGILYVNDTYSGEYIRDIIVILHDDYDAS